MNVAEVRRRALAKDRAGDILTIEEAQVLMLDWLASLGHRVEYGD